MAFSVVLATASFSSAQKDAGKPAPVSGTTAAAPLDWRTLEAPLLKNHIQITDRSMFLKAGEAYFDHQDPPRWIIFQAIPVPAKGQIPDPFYSMYVAKLTRDEGGHITGIETPVLVSPPGSANTCGWFSPVSPYKLLFASTIKPPARQESSGFKVGDRKYEWMFPAETEVATRTVPEIYRDKHRDAPQPEWTGDAVLPVPAFERPLYDAECSYSKDGRFILYARVREGGGDRRPDPDIYIYDTKTQKHHALITAEGYDGGPFFSPDEKWICYRSDRNLDDHLQIFAAELSRDADGVPTGIKREVQLTDDGAVNWAPYWHTSGKFLVYGSSAVSHGNYEIFAVDAALGDASAKPGSARKRRVTFGNGADVLPVFSDNGKLMMWTAQRGPMAEGESKPSSQVWIAELNAGGMDSPGTLFNNLPEQRPEGTTPAPR